MTAFPAARAGAIFQVERSQGAFHGVMITAGPAGIRFDDLLLIPLRLLRASRHLRQYYRRRWPCILIDEYQDTNDVQHALVRLLVGEEKNICVVGDDAILATGVALGGFVEVGERAFVGGATVTSSPVKPLPSRKATTFPALSPRAS